MKFAKLTKTASKVSAAAVRKAPELLTAASAASSIGGVVCGCIATTKVKGVIEEFNCRMNALYDSNLSATDMKKAMVKIYMNAFAKIGALYAPAVFMETVSIVCLINVNRIHKKRMAAMSAAYAALDAAFKSYRDRVIEKFGEKVDEELRLGLKSEIVEETSTDESGNQITKVDEQTYVDGSNPFVRLFNEQTTRYWVGEVSSNLTFIRGVERMLNHDLRINKRVFLNEALGALGFPTTQMGQVVGWRLDEANPSGDNYISFGLFNVDGTSTRNASDFKTNNIVIEFNCDGEILGYLPKQ